MSVWQSLVPASGQTINPARSFTADGLNVGGAYGSVNGVNNSVFNITKAAEGATFKNMTFTRCYAGNGSAIYHNTTTNLTMENVTFGALHDASAEKNRLLLTKDTDVDTAKACVATSQGGSVYSKTNGALSLTNCRFYGSTGRAIYLEHPTVTTLSTTLRSCDFVGCSTTSYGSALCDDDNDSFSNEMVIDNCVFTDCTGGSWSGAVIGRAKTTRVSDSTFRNCWTPGGSNQGGGAIHIQYNTSGATAELTRTRFDNCHISNGSGGAVYLRNNKDRATIYGCEFNDCYAVTGGAVYSDKTTALNIGKAAFPTEEVSAGTSVGKTGSEIHTLFSGCHATNGGAVYNTGGATMSAGDASFNDCYAKTSGGAIYTTVSATTGQAATTGRAELSNVNIDGHKTLAAATASAANGGAVYLASGSLVVKGGTIQNCSTTAANTGAVHLASGAKIYLEGNAVIYDNHALNSTQQKNVALIRSTVADYSTINTTGEGLGENAKVGIYVVGSTATTEPYKSHGFAGQDFGTFGDSQADSSDNLDCFINDRNTKLVGVAHAEGESMHLIQWVNGQICKITTDGNGTGKDILLYKDAHGLTPAVYSTVKKGFTAANGSLYTKDGAPYTEAVKLKLLGDVDMAEAGVTYSGSKDLTFTTAEDSDTAATLAEWDDYLYEPTYITQGASTDPYSTIRVSGKAILMRAKNAGSLFVVNTDQAFTVDNLLFDGAAGTYACTGNGNALCITKAASLGLKDVIFQNLTAGDGGAVYFASDCTLNTAGSVVFKNCTATSGGGAGEHGGGAISAYRNLVVANAGALSFDTCRATNGQGGAVNVYGSASSKKDYTHTCEITNEGTILFSNCSAKYDAGALGVQENNLTIDNRGPFSFTDCTLENEQGGAINIDAGVLTVENTDNATLSFTRCKAVNTSNGQGGAVYAGKLTAAGNAGQIRIDSCEAGKEGGAIYLTASTSDNANADGSLTISASKASGFTVSDCTSSSSGGAIYAAGSTAITASAENAVSISGNTASAKGGAIFVSNGKSLTLNGGVSGVGISVTGNSSTNGGAISVGNSSSRLYVAGNVSVYNNFEGVGDDRHQKNVVLDQDSNDVINVLEGGLGGNAKIGVYVTGDQGSATSIYGKHGDTGDPFGTRADDANFLNLCKFVNDINGLEGVAADESRVIWIPDVKAYVSVDLHDLDSTFIEENLKIDYRTPYNWAPVGIVTIPGSYFIGKTRSLYDYRAPLATTDDDWDKILGYDSDGKKIEGVTGYLADLDKSAIVGGKNQQNKVSDFAGSVIRDYEGVEHTGKSSLFYWGVQGNAYPHRGFTTEGFNGYTGGWPEPTWALKDGYASDPRNGTTIVHHLDLHFEQATVSFYYGKNELGDLDGQKIEDRNYFLDTVISAPGDLPIPEECTLEGFYKDADFTQEWDFHVTEKAMNIYVKLSSGEAKVILRRADDAYTVQPNRKLVIHRRTADGKEIVNTNPDKNLGENATTFVSRADGVFYVGTLPFGTYYVHDVDLNADAEIKVGAQGVIEEVPVEGGAEGEVTERRLKTVHFNEGGNETQG